MPYEVVKQGSNFLVQNKDTKKVHGKHPTKYQANQHMKALYANEPKDPNEGKEQ